ncbi:related to AIM1 |uniref:Related to AIM1 \|nr:related to AIM1 \
MLNTFTSSLRFSTARTLSSSATSSTLRHTSPPVVRNFSFSSKLFNQAQTQTEGEQKIRQILTQKFKPSVLKVQDVSGGCGSFYAIQLSSQAFKGLSTVKAHRMVNQELKDVIKDIHGLQLRTVAEE